MTLYLILLIFMNTQASGLLTIFRAISGSKNDEKTHPTSHLFPPEHLNRSRFSMNIPNFDLKLSYFQTQLFQVRNHDPPTFPCH